MAGQHHYALKVQWTGNKGSGTSKYNAYERSHVTSIDNKSNIEMSSDPAFRGDKTKHNPEEFLVAAISSCHMLSYLYLCAVNGVVVTAYEDNATGTVVETPDGGGHFTEVTLFPTVTVTEQLMVDKANALHEKAHALCFIANSVNFPVHHSPSCYVQRN